MKDVLKKVWVVLAVAGVVVGEIFNFIFDNIEFEAPNRGRHQGHDGSSSDDSPIKGTYDHASSYYSSMHDD